MESKETMMSTEEATPQTVNFIEAIIKKILMENVYIHDFHQSQMGIYILVMRNPFV